jgi:hypothetical protein
MAAPAGNLATDVVRRAGAGEVVRPTVTDFLSAATRLLEDHDGRKRYAVQARRYAEHSFDIDQIQDQFLDVFNFALQREDEGRTCGLRERK